MQQWQSHGMRLNSQRSCEGSGTDERIWLFLISTAFIEMHQEVWTYNWKLFEEDEEQMGVEIVGVAAYQDDTGKLCTFEYVICLCLFFFG